MLVDAVLFRVVNMVLFSFSVVCLYHGESPWAPVMQSSRLTEEVYDLFSDAALLGPGENDATGLDNSLRATVASRKLQVSSSSSVHSKPKSLRDILGELVAGVILFFMSIGILWVNEGHAVKIKEANEFTSIE